MHLVLSQEVIAAIVTVGLTVVAGAIGYLIRERATSAKPFVAILEIDGGALAANNRVEVPQDVVESLKGSALFEDLVPSSRLRDITERWQRLASFNQQCPVMLRYCSSLSRALKRGNIDDVQSVLYELFRDRFSDDQVSLLIFSGAVSVPAANESLPIVLPCTFEAKYDGGCYSVAIAGNTTTVSRNLTDAPLLGKQRIEAFIELVRRLELPKLSAVFFEIERIIQQSQGVAAVAAPKLEEILDQNSQWSFKIFAANLGTTPFLVAPQINLFVQDTTKAEYSEQCELVLLEQDSSGEEVRRGSSAPLILRAQSDLTFIVVTAAVQAKMERGGELRQVFKSGKARCQIGFHADQVGFRRRIDFNSPKVLFRSADG